MRLDRFAVRQSLYPLFQSTAARCGWHKEAKQSVLWGRFNPQPRDAAGTRDTFFRKARSVSIHSRAMRLGLNIATFAAPDMFQSTAARCGWHYRGQVSIPNICFNPQPRDAAGTSMSADSARYCSFNPQPRDAAGSPALTDIPSLSVSIHSRAMRLDPVTIEKEYISIVSIHSRAMRLDAGEMARSCDPTGFNPQPRDAAGSLPLLSLRLVLFQSTAARCGW